MYTSSEDFPYTSSKDFFWVQLLLSATDTSVKEVSHHGDEQLETRALESPSAGSGSDEDKPESKRDKSKPEHSKPYDKREEPEHRITQREAAGRPMYAND